MITRYEYDGLGRRVKAHIDSQAPENPDGIDLYRHFYYNNSWQLLETRDTTTEDDHPETLAVEMQYVWSARYIDAPILRDRDADGNSQTGNLGKTGSGLEERLYYLTDANMNVTTLVDTGGDALERYIYDPYGKVTVLDADWSADADGKSDYANSILFCGYYFDNETGLYHVRNRYYDFALGRWVTRDPIGTLPATQPTVPPSETRTTRREPVIQVARKPGDVLQDALSSATYKLAERLGSDVVAANPSLLQYADSPNLLQYGLLNPIRYADPSGYSVYCGDVTCHCGGKVGDVTVPVYGCSRRAKVILYIGYRSGGCFVPGNAVYCTMPCDQIDLTYFMPHECCHVCERKKGFGNWLRSWIPGDLESPKYCDRHKVNYTFTKKGP